MAKKETVLLKAELNRTAKRFYEVNTPEDICDWFEDYINASLVSKRTLTEIIKGYGERAKDVESMFIGGLQKLIDEIRAADNAKENLKD